MRSIIKKSSVVMASMAAVLAIAGTAQANASSGPYTGGPYTVQPQTCSISGFGANYSGSGYAYYVGDGHFVAETCTADFVSGTPISTIQVVNSGGCLTIFTPRRAYQYCQA